MILLNSSTSLAPTPAVVGGTTTYTSAAYQMQNAEADEPLTLSVDVGALAGTGPTIKVEVQTLPIGQSTATGKWVTAYTTPTLTTLTQFYNSISVPLAGKIRFKITTANADNTGTPTVTIISRTKPSADANP